MQDDAAPLPEQSHAREGLPLRKVALTVAGFDPSSGAGITADLKVFSNHGLYGVAAITALTVQSTQGVRNVQPVAPSFLRETLDCLVEDMPIAGVKIGMLATTAIIREVADFLRGCGVARGRIILDPVLISSSGAALLEPDAVRILREEILPHVGWVTPNVDELLVLADPPGPALPPSQDRTQSLHPGSIETSPNQRSPDEISSLAKRLADAASGLNVVVTGGHLDPPDDLLLTAGGESAWFAGSRIDTSSTHGTGCVFSSALLSRILLGDQPAEAVRAAKAFVVQALRVATPLGKGKGPVL